MQYTNSIRDLNIIAILFILGLDLNIGLIHVIVQQIQKIRCFHRCYRNVLPTKKSLVKQERLCNSKKKLAFFAM